MKTIYEWTGEYRPPKEGEWYLDDINEGMPTKADDDDVWKFWILSPRQIEEAKDE